jgi:hypothetical protein
MNSHAFRNTAVWDNPDAAPLRRTAMGGEAVSGASIVIRPYEPNLVCCVS